MERADIDLFEHKELLPPAVKAILDAYDDWGYSYTECEELLEKLKPHGYTFDYYLDGEPYNLRQAE